MELDLTDRLIGMLLASLYARHNGPRASMPTGGKAGPAPTKPPALDPRPTNESEVGLLITLINDKRQAKGLKPFRVDPKLMGTAQAFSVEMASNRHFDHRDGNGLWPGDRMTHAGYTWKAEGEDIAFGQTAAFAVVKAWEEDPPHATIMFSDVYEDVGVGEAADRDGGKYWTMDVAEPTE